MYESYGGNSAIHTLVRQERDEKISCLDLHRRPFLMDELILQFENASFKEHLQPPLWNGESLLETEIQKHLIDSLSWMVHSSIFLF